MTALDKALAARKEQGGTPADARAVLVKRLKAIDPDKVVAYVEANSLPASTGKWTLEQLRDTVVTLETGKAPERAPVERNFIIVYNPEALISVTAFTQEAWDALEPEEGTEALNITSADDLADVPTDVLLSAFNQGKGTKAKKFANAETAREQAFAALGSILDAAGSVEAAKTKKAAAKTPKAPKEPAAPKLMNKEPKAKDQIKVVGAGTKIAQLIDLLARPKGTTVDEITSTLSAVGKPISARAWLGYDLNTVAGYGVREEDGRLYIVYPKGMTAPLAHKEKAAPVAKATPAAKKAAPVAEVVEEPAPAAKVAAICSMGRDVDAVNRKPRPRPHRMAATESAVCKRDMT